jgi:hypothetical protein
MDPGSREEGCLEQEIQMEATTSRLEAVVLRMEVDSLRASSVELAAVHSLLLKHHHSLEQLPLLPPS